MNVLNILLGFIVLVTGRKLYWLFVAVVGFVAGLYIASNYIQVDPHWLVYLIALAVGVVGAVAGVFLQHAVIAIVGFIAGGYGAFYLAGLLGLKAGTLYWIFFVVGGILGIILVAALFEWALILLSSWAGATLISQGINPNGGVVVLAFIALFLVGVLIQAASMAAEHRRKPVEEKVKEEKEKIVDEVKKLG